MDLEMNNIRSINNTAKIVGILFIIGTAAGILSAILLGPIQGAPDYLAQFSANKNSVTIGALLLFIMAFACSGIAIWLYPVLRRYDETLALGAVSFRVVEGVFDIVAGVILLSLLTLSNEFVTSGSTNTSYLQALGTLLIAGTDWVNNLAVLLPWCLGALMYYYIFYRTKLIPRWLSGWGIIGIALMVLSCLLYAFGSVGSGTIIDVLLKFPIALQEMVMAVWLIVKGFDQSALASGYARDPAQKPLASEG